MRIIILLLFLASTSAWSHDTPWSCAGTKGTYKGTCRDIWSCVTAIKEVAFDITTGTYECKIQSRGLKSDDKLTCAQNVKFDISPSSNSSNINRLFLNRCFNKTYPNQNKPFYTKTFLKK